MNKLPILVDICNTLADINGIIEKELGPNPTPSCYRHPGANEVYFLNNLWIFKEAKALEGSAYALQKLSEKYTIVYATARPIQAGSITKMWLGSNGYPDGYLLHSQNKLRLAEILHPDFTIEDAPHEIDSYKNGGFKVLVKSQPYNTLYSHRFEWEEFSMLA